MEPIQFHFIKNKADYNIVFDRTSIWLKPILLAFIRRLTGTLTCWTLCKKQDILVHLRLVCFSGSYIVCESGCQWIQIWILYPIHMLLYINIKDSKSVKFLFRDAQETPLMVVLCFGKLISKICTSSFVLTKLHVCNTWILIRLI